MANIRSSLSVMYHDFPVSENLFFLRIKYFLPLENTMIWYCNKTMCDGPEHEGWVIGQQGKVSPDPTGTGINFFGDPLFSQFEKWNNYRIFMRYNAGKYQREYRLNGKVNGYKFLPRCFQLNILLQINLQI